MNYKKLNWQLKPPWAGNGNITLEPTSSGTLLKLQMEYELPNSEGILDKALNALIRKRMEANTEGGLDYFKYISEKQCQQKTHTVEAY